MATSLHITDDLIVSRIVRLLYKGVTYECLKDSDFIEVAKTAFPDLVLSEEFDAARER